MIWSEIDWSNRNSLVSRLYTVKDAIYLPRWGRLADDRDGLDDNAKAALIDVFQRMEKVTDILGVTVSVHCAFRSNEYNRLVGGAKASAHIARGVQMPPKVIPDGTEIGNGIKHIAAVDFDANIGEASAGANCDKVREILKPKLEELDMRMEQNPGSDWVHLDTKPVRPGDSRIFTP